MIKDISIPGKKAGILFYMVLAAFLVLAMLTGEWQTLLFPFVLAIGYAAWQSPRQIFYLLLITLPFSFEYNFNDGFSTDIPDEILMLLLTFLSIAFLVYKPSLLQGILRNPVIQWLLAWIAWMAISALFSTHPIVSLKFLLSKSWYIGAFILAPILFWENSRMIVLSAKVYLISLFVVVLIIMARHGLQGFRFDTIHDAVSPFFRNHVNYAAMLVCTIPVMIAFYVGADKKAKPWLAAAILLIILPAVFLSYSRGAWLALGTGAVAWWLIRVRKLVFFYVLTVSIAIISLAWLSSGNRYLKYAHDFETTIFHKDFREHLQATYQLKDISAAERFHRWVAAVRMTGEEPLTGFGPGTFYNNYKSYTIPSFKTWVSNNPEKSTAHNYFLLTASEQGIMGVLLLIILLGACLWYAQHLYHQADDQVSKMMAAVSGIMLVMIITLNLLSDLVETDKVGSLFFLSIAILIVADKKQKKVRAHGS